MLPPAVLLSQAPQRGVRSFTCSASGFSGVQAVPHGPAPDPSVRVAVAPSLLFHATDDLVKTRGWWFC